jgi:hypothetical protein
MPQCAKRVRPCEQRIVRDREHAPRGTPTKSWADILAGELLDPASGEVLGFVDLAVPTVPAKPVGV